MKLKKLKNDDNKIECVKLHSSHKELRANRSRLQEDKTKMCDVCLLRCDGLS